MQKMEDVKASRMGLDSETRDRAGPFQRVNRRASTGVRSTGVRSTAARSTAARSTAARSTAARSTAASQQEQVQRQWIDPKPEKKTTPPNIANARFTPQQVAEAPPTQMSIQLDVGFSPKVLLARHFGTAPSLSDSQPNCFQLQRNRENSPQEFANALFVKFPPLTQSNKC
jgi:hypothetical protein